MRKVVLSDSDFAMFDHDIRQDDYDFYLRHKDAFKRMWMEQVNHNNSMDTLLTPNLSISHPCYFVRTLRVICSQMTKRIPQLTVNGSDIS